jgi:hypothetical protein
VPLSSAYLLYRSGCQVSAVDVVVRCSADEVAEESPGRKKGSKKTSDKKKEGTTRDSTSSSDKEKEKKSKCVLL